MESGDEHDDFSSLVAAALATHQTLRRDGDNSNEKETSAPHPMLAHIGSYELFPDSQAEDSPDLAVRLGYRFDVFRSGTVSWGLVDDWRPDGSVYKRLGIIIELEIDVSDAVLKADRRAQKQRHIREAIDLVQLVIALDPMSLKPTLKRCLSIFKRRRFRDCDDELSALARGVPWDLRLKFDLSIAKSGPFQSEFINNLFQKYDEALSANAVVRAELKISSYSLDDSILATEDFFQYVSALLPDLNRYQTSHNARRWSRHCPFQVEKVILKLSPVHITPEVVRLTKLLMKAPISVQLARLHLDFSLISCTDNDLRKFVQTITTGATRLSVGTGTKNDPSENIAIDAERQNRFKRISALIRLVGEIHSIRTLNLGPLLRMCAMSLNREAVWRGLFGDVLPRHEQLDQLTFRVGMFSPMQIELDEEEGELIEDCVAWAREANPDQKFRVRHLHIHFAGADMGALRALLSAFDDVEKLTLACDSNIRQVTHQVVTTEVFQAIFRYPSISSIFLRNVTVLTMDIFNPSILDPRVPTKPALRELDLFRVAIGEPESLSPFIGQLNPSGSTASGIATTLEHFHVTTPERIPILQPEVCDLLDNALCFNRKLRHIGISVPSDDPECVKQTRDILCKHSGRQLPPSEAMKQTEIAKLRKIAFLSAMSDAERISARCRLDSALVTQIFAFSAPCVVRTTSEDRHY